MLPVTGEAKKLFLALKSKLIKDSSFDEVKDVLRKVLYKLGIRENNWPNDIEKLVLFEHIVENYGGNRLDEIRLAFDMAITQGLPDENGEVVETNTFENFSCLYFSKIMNAYRRWSAQEYKLVIKPDSPEQRIFTDEELDESKREDAERQYQLYIRGHQLKYVEANKEILVKDGLMKPEDDILEFFHKRAEALILNLYTR
jgi:hypothetical protein